MRGLLFPSLLAAVAVRAAKVGLFEADECADAKGFEQCYADADEAYSDCINKNCNGISNPVDCHNVCSCINVESQIDCVGAHCWNKVYSCEYQDTAGAVGTFCPEPKVDQIPFFPPPDKAPGSCSCNTAKLLLSIYRTDKDYSECGANSEEVLHEMDDAGNLDDFTYACTCCMQSGLLSAFWNICPDTDPSILGADFVFDTLGDDKYPQCGAYLEAYPCDTKFGFSPPGDKGAEFYKPGDFPANGTKTTSNLGGAITSPVSGKVYSYTRGSFVRTVSVASANAKPTATSSSTKSGDGDKGDGTKDESSSSSSSSSDKSSDDGSEDDEDAASLTTPTLMFVGVPLLLAVVGLL